MKVGSAPQAEINHSGANRVIREPVDNDEAAGPAILCVRIESHRGACRKIANPDVVEPERMRRKVLARIDIDFVLDGGNRDRGRLGSDARQIGPAGHQRMIAHPDQMRGELIRYFGTRRWRNENIPPCDVDIVGQRHGNGISRLR